MLTTGLLLLALPQTPQVLLTEGLPMPGDPQQTVTSVGNTAVNTVGGWAVGASVNDPAGTLSLIFGTASGAGPTALATEALHGVLQQTSFESFFGIDDLGAPVYSASSDNTFTGVTGLDGCWAGSTVIANEDDPILSLPGKVFRFNSRPNVLANGEPVWVGGVNDISGTSEGNGLFRGASHIPVIVETDVIPGMPYTLSPNCVDFDFRFSPSGDHYITPVDLASPSPLEDIYIDYDGAALFIGGLIVGEDQPMPAALQLDPTENWDNFDFFGVMDDGTYFFTGDTSGPSATDEFVCIDGSLALREGDTVDGLTISGSIEGGYLSSRGDWAVIWDVEDPGAGNVEALIYNGRLLMKETDTISTDLTGDGFPENGTISNFTGISALTVGADRACYFTCDLDYLGTSSTTDDVEVAVRLQVPDLIADGDSVSVAQGGAIDFTLFSPPDVVSDFYALAGSLSGTAPGIPVDGLILPLNLDSYFLYTLKLNAAPLQNNQGFFDANGTASAGFDLPPGLGPVLVGLTLHHAYASVNLQTFSATHVSNPVAIDLVP